MFFRARLKLSAFYAGSFLIIFVILSFATMKFFDMNFFREMELAPEGDHYVLPLDVFVMTDHKLYLAMVVLNPVLALLSLVAGWLLAGRTLKPIQENVKLHKQFVSDAAHELRTPLAIMKAGLETAEVGDTPSLEGYRNLKADMTEEIDRLVNLANDLLFLSRGNLNAKRQKKQVDISALCERNVNVMQVYATAKQVEVHKEIQPFVSCLGDEDQLSRLIMNLMKNAIDYNREGGWVMMRLIQPQKRGRKFTLSVADNGIGISQEHLPQIYKRFYKVDDARERSDSGTGLGLSIVQAIVKAHHGEIKVDSAPSRGTQFTITLDAA